MLPDVEPTSRALLHLKQQRAASELSSVSGLVHTMEAFDVGDGRVQARTIEGVDDDVG